jgi:hypothetical protein
VRRAKLPTNGTIFNKRTQILGYADDIENLQRFATNNDLRRWAERGDNFFEVFKEFMYLGSLVTPNNDVSPEIQRRIQTANRCFFRLRKQLGHISRSVKFIIYKTLIRPVLLYGSETWVLTKREENQLLLF